VPSLCRQGSAAIRQRGDSALRRSIARGCSRNDGRGDTDQVASAGANGSQRRSVRECASRFGPASFKMGDDGTRGVHALGQLLLRQPRASIAPPLSTRRGTACARAKTSPRPSSRWRCQARERSNLPRGLDRLPVTEQPPALSHYREADNEPADVPHYDRRKYLVNDAHEARGHWLALPPFGHEPRADRRAGCSPAQRARQHHRRRPLFHVTAHSNPEGNPRQDPAGAAARTSAAATEAIRPAASECGKETARRTLTGWLCYSLCGRVRMRMMANREPIAVRLQKI
jgi:hypothetical protein